LPLHLDKVGVFMKFQVEKDAGIIPQILTQILDGSVNGITLSDPDQEDNPIVYANKAFAKITGYSIEETIGRNCRFLHEQDKDQDDLQKIRDAIKNQASVEVTLKNFRKNGELFYNRLSITPLFDNEGNLIYFMGVQYDVTEQFITQQEIKNLTETLDMLRNSQAQ
jgi:PAS domain S-box-containing protein